MKHALVIACALGLMACAKGSDEDADVPDEPSPTDSTNPTIPSKTPGKKEAQPPAEAGPAFATRVVSFTPGRCAGFGSSEMPGIVLGPPKGAGDAKGSLDVVSLGNGGEIVLSFEPRAIVDGDGADFIVFENAFYPAGDREKPYAEPAEVSVSEDGTTWVSFPCTATAAPYGACAGWHPVLSSPESGISPTDPSAAGGDAYDLASVGLTTARFVRIKDKTAQRCTSTGPDTNGFDLDAVALVHASAR
jgi:hypothetical protein